MSENLCDSCAVIPCGLRVDGFRTVRCINYRPYMGIPKWVTKNKPKGKAMKKFNITGEASRTYNILVFDEGELVITINEPQYLFLYPGKTGHAFHRVQDGGGTMHLVHAPGPVYNGQGELVGWCTVSWEAKDVNKPCAF